MMNDEQLWAKAFNAIQATQYLRLVYKKISISFCFLIFVSIHPLFVRDIEKSSRTLKLLEHEMHYECQSICCYFPSINRNMRTRHSRRSSRSDTILKKLVIQQNIYWKTVLHEISGTLLITRFILMNVPF